MTEEKGILKNQMIPSSLFQKFYCTIVSCYWGIYRCKHSSSNHILTNFKDKCLEMHAGQHYDDGRLFLNHVHSVCLFSLASDQLVLLFCLSCWFSALVPFELVLTSWMLCFFLKLSLACCFLKKYLHSLFSYAIDLFSTLPTSSAPPAPQDPSLARLHSPPA